MDHYLIKDKSEIKNEIITIVEKACQELDSNILDYLEHGISINPVSYTHLRAHETSQDLVCTLLLEKKKNKSTQ
ncbi:hypothetical protein ACH0C5_21240, partial [Escherichia coli]